ncbi:MAG: ferredoxin reductase [Nitrolancea sp.]
MERAAVSGRLRWWNGEVVEKIQDTPTASSMTVNVPGWPGHRAGQHVDVRLTAEDGYQAVRSYSIASAPDDPNLMLTIERLDDGEVSPYLVDDVLPGDPIEFLGPIGGFFVWSPDMGGPLLLIAGGSGIAPLMSIARHRVRTGSDVPLRMLYSARSDQDLIFRNELDEAASSHSGFELTYTLTRRHPPGWTGFARRIDLDMLRDVAWEPAQQPIIYICGPTPFVEVASSLLLELGHDPQRIRTERFGPTGG